MENYTKYQEFIKPDWAPPAWLFGPVWTVLYVLIFISFSYVFYQYLKGKVSFKFILPFILNLFFNLIFTPIQFGLENNLLAFADIVLVLVTLVWIIKSSWKKYSWVSVMNIPYLLWVSFATFLQATVTYLNF
jgi:tryptophan-rich sensory protein